MLAHAEGGSLGKKWRVFVKMIQTIWDQGEIPMQMSWMVVVLLPKGGGDFRGIGLLDPFWKVVEKVMVRRLGTIEFHPCLHGGLPKRGTGTDGDNRGKAGTTTGMDGARAAIPGLRRPEEGI